MWRDWTCDRKVRKAVKFVLVFESSLISSVTLVDNWCIQTTQLITY